MMQMTKAFLLLFLFLVVGCGSNSVVLEGPEDSVEAVAFSPDGKKLASISLNESIRLWILNDPDAEPTLLALGTSRFPILRTRDIAFSPDGKMLAATGCPVQVWDLTTSPPISKPLDSVGCALLVAFSSDSKYLAISTRKVNDATVRLVDLSNLEAKPQLLYRSDNISANFGALAFSPNSDLLVVGGDDGLLRLFTISDPERSYISLNHHSAILAAAFSPDGRLLATCGNDNTARLWNLEKPDDPPIEIEHKDKILSVAFSPDGRTLATTGRKIQLWNLYDLEASSRQLRVNFFDVVTDIDFSPSGDQLASSVSDGTIHLWEMKD